MSRFKSDSLTISYDTWGNGHPIVLVHGWGSNTKSNWIDTGWVDALSRHRQVIGIDCRGHGKSDKPHVQSLYGYSDMARDVTALMDHLDIEKADYLGYSMGSFIGVSLLSNRPGRFSSMILGGIGNETEESQNACFIIAEALRETDPNNVGSKLGQAYRSFIDSDPDNDPESLALSALEMWPQGYPVKLGGPALSQAKCPVLIVNGSEDHPYIDSMQELADALPNAQTHVLSDRDHLTAVSDPAFKEAAIAFLKGQG